MMLLGDWFSGEKALALGQSLTPTLTQILIGSVVKRALPIRTGTRTLALTLIGTAEIKHVV